MMPVATDQNWKEKKEIPAMDRDSCIDSCKKQVAGAGLSPLSMGGDIGVAAITVHGLK
jgi:hypothetical protein